MLGLFTLFVSDCFVENSWTVAAGQRQLCWYFMSDAAGDHNSVLNQCRNQTTANSYLAYILDSGLQAVFDAIINQ